MNFVAEHFSLSMTFHVNRYILQSTRGAMTFKSQYLFNLHYTYTKTIWNTQGFNHTADQKLSTPDSGWGRISLLVFTLWFHSEMGRQHMGPWHARQRSQSIMTAEAKGHTRALLTPALAGPVLQSQSHLLPTGLWDDSSWRREWLATLLAEGDSRSHATVKSFIQSGCLAPSLNLIYKHIN